MKCYLILYISAIFKIIMKQICQFLRVCFVHLFLFIYLFFGCCCFFNITDMQMFKQQTILDLYLFTA